MVSGVKLKSLLLVQANIIYFLIKHMSETEKRWLRPKVDKADSEPTEQPSGQDKEPDATEAARLVRVERYLEVRKVLGNLDAVKKNKKNKKRGLE